MTVDQLVDDLRRRGVVIEIEGTSLRLQAPRGVVDSALRDEIARRKQDVMEYLRRDPRPPIGVTRHRKDGAFHYVEGFMGFGDICYGWKPHRWAEELRRKASRCDGYRPDMADYYRAWATDIEARLKN